MGGSAGAAPTPNPMMEEMARIMMGWGQEDRARYESLFRPVEDAFVADAVNYDTPERRAQEAAKAAASVRTQADVARGMQTRQMTAMGVNPNSGRYADSMTRGAMAEGLAVVGAKNLAEQQVQQEGRNRMGQAVNLGQGSAINPGTSMAAAGNLMNADYGNQMAAYNANQQSQAGLWGGIGSAVGAGLSLWGIPSFEGGGYTGRGARRGGVDGKGGFMAVLHPDEVVVDMAKPGARGALKGAKKTTESRTRGAMREAA